MSGFSAGLMTGLLTANAAVAQAQTHQNTISHMDAQKQTLEAEIKSGYGDIEGKMAELEEIAAQRETTEGMRQDALNEANASIGAATAEDRTEANRKPGEADKDTQTEEPDENGAVSQKASDKAGELRETHDGHNIAAVDYQKDMQIAKDGKTNVAVSPRYLEKLADGEDAAAFDAVLGQMEQISRDSQTESVKTQTWAVDGGGQIRHYSTLAEGTNAQDARAYADAMNERGAAAFGGAFAGAFVTLPGEAPATADGPAENTGLLVDLSM